MKLIKVKNKLFMAKVINCQKSLTLFLEAIIHTEDVTAKNHVSKNLVWADTKQKF